MPTLSANRQIAEGSGLGSGKMCRIIPWTDTRAKAISREYPFIGGRTLQGMRWVAVEFEDGTVDTFPKNRIIEVTR
jgi:hypothetical protein